MSLKNCLPPEPRLGRVDRARLAALDGYGACSVLRCHSLHVSDLATGEPTTLLEVDGQGLLETFFLEVEGVSPGAIAHARLAFHVDGQTEKQRHRQERGHFNSRTVGWPHRSTEPPHQATMYRLFENDPLVFNRSLRVLWSHQAGSPVRVKSELLVSTEA